MALSAKDIQFQELKDTISQLNTTISAQNTLIVQLQKTIEAAEIREEECIFRKNCASVPEERSAIPLQTEQSSAG